MTAPQNPDDIRRALFRAQAARCLWLWRESVADQNPNGWHLTNIVRLARDFRQPVPDAVRDALARAFDAMLDGDEPATALHLKDARGGSPRKNAGTAAQRARINRWLELYLPPRLGGVINGAENRFSTAEEAYSEAERIFKRSRRTIKGDWIDYRESRTR